MKKSTWIKIAAILVAAIPPVVVLVLNYPILISRWDKTVSISAIIVGIILLLIFKDAVKKFFITPGYLKFSVVILILSLLGLSLGEQLVQISLTATISGLCALPLNIWYNHITKPVTNDEMIESLNKIIKENHNEE